eukprot:UN02277
MYMSTLEDSYYRYIRFLYEVLKYIGSIHFL